MIYFAKALDHVEQSKIKINKWESIMQNTALLPRFAFERMRNRQMKLHVNHIPRRVPNELDVSFAFKFSIKQFTPIYPLRWSQFSLSSQRFITVRTNRTRCVLLQIKDTLSEVSKHLIPQECLSSPSHRTGRVKHE